MIELTLEQRKAVATDAEVPPRVLDPNTHTRYVLVPEEVYDRVKRVFEADFEADEDSQFVCEMTPQVLKIFGRDGWDDPAMDVYNELDPRIKP